MALAVGAGVGVNVHVRVCLPSAGELHAHRLDRVFGQLYYILHGSVIL